MPVACEAPGEAFPALFKLRHFPQTFSGACVRSRVCSAGTCGFNIEQKKILAGSAEWDARVRARAACNFNAT